MHQPTTQTRLRPFKPTAFGRYTLLMPLATGGMGEIFLARLEGMQGFEKQCVIKKILPHLTQEEDFVTRFVNEAKTLVQLQHGSIAQVLDMGLNEDEPYLALEFVDGKDLRKIAARARERNMPLPITFVLYTMSRVLDALAYAHRKRDEDEKEIGLVHRDVSPQNILISYEGEVKVIDFGLAKSTLNVAKTNPSIVLGKFLYMSPEQARHQRIDRRSDLYSVGLCLYELIAGKNPFDEVPPGELMARVASPTIPNIQQVEPLCPGPVAAIVGKALAIDPAQRYQTAEEFRGKLMSVLLDIDPSAGPESASRFMRDAFSAEYSSERKLLASLRDYRVVAPAPAVEPMPPPKHPVAAVRNLTDVARRSQEMPELTPMPTDPKRLGKEEFTPTPIGRPLSEPPSEPELTKPGRDAPPMLAPTPVKPKGLSFAPTPRLKEDDGRAQNDRETMPSINLLNLPSVEVDPGSSGPLVVAGELLDPIPVLHPPNVAGPTAESLPSIAAVPTSPWGSNETTTPAGPAFEVARESPLNLPAVMTSEPSETFEPGKSPASLEARRPMPQPVLPNRPIIAPLPAALKNKAPPSAYEETGKTRQSRGGFIWVIIPILAVLGVAAFVLYDVYQQEIEKRFNESLNNRPLGMPQTEDRKSREVAPTQVETETTGGDEPEPLAPPPVEDKGPAPAPPVPAPEATADPAPAPVPAPAPPTAEAAPPASDDVPLAPLKSPPPAKPVKKKQRQR